MSGSAFFNPADDFRSRFQILDHSQEEQPRRYDRTGRAAGSDDRSENGLGKPVSSMSAAESYNSGAR
jgi:hypothetical protein